MSAVTEEDAPREHALEVLEEEPDPESERQLHAVASIDGVQRVAD